MFRLGESVRRCAFALLLLLFLPAHNAHAVIGTLDPVPAATLLYPYFEVDLSNASGKNTLIGVQNTSATAILGRVTVWTNAGVPIYNFNIYLTGYDMQSFDMRSVLTGTLPQSASAGQDPTDVLSPHGPLSQDINFASCTGHLPPAPLSAATVTDLQAMLTGKPSTTQFAGQCVGTSLGDNVARGYLTIDTTDSCSSSPDPIVDAGSLAGYFANDNAGVAGARMTNQNVMLGDYMLINPAQQVLITSQAASIEASPGIGNSGSDYPGSPQTTTPNNYTFYGRFENWSAKDMREPLPSNWSVQGDTGNGNVIIWRDPKVGSAPAFACSPGQPAYAPLGQTGIRFFQRSSQYTAIPTPPSFAPVATQLVPLNNASMSLPPLKMGFLDMDLNTTVAAAGPITLVDPASSQSLVVVLNTNKNQAFFSGGVNATPTKRPAIAPTASLVMTSNNAVANGTAQDLATVTLRDQNNNPAGFITVNFTVTPGANLVQSSCVTSSSGTCSVALTSATAGFYNVSASFTENLVNYNLGPVGAGFVDTPSAANSTLTITTDHRQADGVSQDVAAVLVQDSSNRPAGGVVVTFTVAAGATIVNAGGQCTTDNTGKCSVGIKSSTAGTYAVNVTAPIALGPQNVTFAGAPAAAHSTLVMTLNNQQITSFSQDTAQVTLHDASDAPVSGVLVNLTVAAPATLTSPVCSTDVNGQCSVGVKTTTPGSFALSVTSPLALGPVTATFTGPPAAAQSSMVVSINNQPADNTSLDVVQVTIKDASSIPIGNMPVFFNLAPGANFNGSSLCFTNSSGQCTVSIRSSTPGSYAVSTSSPVTLTPVNVTFN